MERQKFELRELFWVIILQLSALTMAANVTNDTPEITEEPTIGLYAWSAWGSWSPCSRSCGGGVSVQERQCLPRSRSLVKNETLTSISTDRQTRQATQDCYGLDKRYHECNTHQCAGGARDMRAVQCSSYDRRPFRGRFYAWIPYIDGDSPCMLNCRPLGQQFYASLALVVDGTPCTKPGYRAICIQGHCKVSNLFNTLLYVL